MPVVQVKQVGAAPQVYDPPPRPRQIKQQEVGFGHVFLEILLPPRVSRVEVIPLLRVKISLTLTTNVGIRLVGLK